MGNASNNLAFVVAAFAVTWGVVIGYLVHLRRVTRRAQTLLAHGPGPSRR